MQWRAPSRGQPPFNDTQEGLDEGDAPHAIPAPDPACLYGLVGEVARAGSDCTEANPYAIAANFMAYLSCAVGRGPYLPVGNTWHHARLFVLHVGRSGRGRKGDAVSLITRLDAALRQLSERAAPQVHRGGLSSREGLVSLIHDGYRRGKEDVPPIEDKRLWVVESEFANVLHQSRREGNTLSAALRDCWDGTSLKPATKSNRLYASHPHLALTGAITPTELLGLMTARELTNGFANRFLMIWAERHRILPFPQATPQVTVNILADRVMQVLEFARADRVVEHDHLHIELSRPAQALYARLYHDELNDASGGERITALLERRAPMLLRLAMLFALSDLQMRVDVHHVEAAMAWIHYATDSVKYIFSSPSDANEQARINESARKIEEFLFARSQATRREITLECFHGHARKSHIDAALERLLNAAPPRIHVQSHARPDGAPGTPTNIYSLAIVDENRAAVSSGEAIIVPASHSSHSSQRHPDVKADATP
jgi:hypothetical protein